jgi:uncharacterized protein YggT (Ycf19 family)
MGGIDFSPLVAILVIMFLKRFIVATLIDIAFKLKAGGGI